MFKMTEKVQVIIPNRIRVKPEPSYPGLERSGSPDLWTHDVDSPSPPPPDPAVGSDEDTGRLDQPRPGGFQPVDISRIKQEAHEFQKGTKTSTQTHESTNSPSSDQNNVIDLSQQPGLVTNSIPFC